MSWFVVIRSKTTTMTKKLLFSLSLLLMSCAFSFAQKGRVYVVDNFDGIKFVLPVELNVTIGSKFEVKAVGSREDIDWITVEKEGNSLCFKSKSGRHHFGGDTKIFVTLPILENLSLAGSGDVNVRGDVKVSSLNVNIAGSGDIIIDKLSTDRFEANVSGSGSIKVGSGSTSNSTDYNIFGSGSISTRALIAKMVSVNIAGSGDVVAFATESLSVKIAGSGNVECYGNPKNVDKVKFGSGSISIR